MILSAKNQYRYHSSQKANRFFHTYFLFDGPIFFCKCFVCLQKNIYEVPRNSKFGFAIRWHQSDIYWLVNLANLIKLSMKGRHSFVFKNASVSACLNSVLLESRVILLCAWSCCLTLLCLRSLYYGVFCLEKGVFGDCESCIFYLIAIKNIWVFLFFLHKLNHQYVFVYRT